MGNRGCGSPHGAGAGGKDFKMTRLYANPALRGEQLDPLNLAVLLGTRGRGPLPPKRRRISYAAMKTALPVVSINTNTNVVLRRKKARGGIPAGK